MKIQPNFCNEPKQYSQKDIQFYLDEIEKNMNEGDFQRDFYESLCEQFENKKSLSEKQMESVVRMYDRVTDIDYDRK